MSLDIFRTPASQKLLAFWKDFKKTSATGGALVALGILCFILAVAFSSRLLYLSGLLVLCGGVYMFVNSKKIWSENALECSYTLNEHSPLKAAATAALLQNPTALLVGFQSSSDIIVVFTVTRSLILQLNADEQTENAASSIKDEIKRHFIGSWKYAELVEPACNIQDISAQCDHITSEYCTEPLSGELADDIRTFSAEVGAVVLLGRPLPNPLPSGVERTAERPVFSYSRPAFQLKHGLIIVSAVILMAGGAFFINRVKHNQAIPVSSSVETTVEQGVPVQLPTDNGLPEETATSMNQSSPEKPEGIRVSDRTMNSITLTWKPAASSSGYEVLRNGYRVARTRNSYFTDEGLRPGTRYTYTLRSYNNTNIFSETSEEFTASTHQDSMPPTVPSNLTMSISGRNMRLTWLAATDNLEVSGYEIFRDGRKIGVTKDTYYTDEGIRSENFSYTVRAFDLAMNYSKHSNQASGTLPDDTPPTVPGDLAYSKTLQSIRLSWSASNDNRNVGGYEIFRDGQKIGTTNNTFYTDDGLTPSTNYNYTVRAFDLSNNYSRHSVSISAGTQSDNIPPTTPGYLKVASSGSHVVRLSWSASSDNMGTVKYDIYMDDTKAGTTSATTFTVEELAPGNSYSFRVKAVDSSGNSSAFSNKVEGDTEKSMVTIYFRKGFATPYLHYQRPNGIWTVAPGVAIPESDVPGYNKITVELGYSDYLMCAFSDGAGKWDPNPPPLCQRGDSAYRFKEGIWTFDSGKIKAGAP